MKDFDSMTKDERAEVIAAAVDSHKAGPMRRALEQALYYETSNPDICGRRKMYAAAASHDEADGTTVIEAVAKENRFASNERVASSFFRDITDQKTQYLAGEGADVNAVDDSDEATDAVAAVYDPMGENVRRVEQMTLTDALVYGRGFAYLQVISGTPRVTHVPYIEVIPQYGDHGELENVIRYYRSHGEERAEYHTAAAVYLFEKGGESDEWEQVGEHPQIIRTTVYGDGTIEYAGGKAWSRLPWFEMRHCNDGCSSLTNAVRSMVRVYDITTSDFANNLIDMQDVFITMKKDGYGSGIDYGEQLELLRNFKVTEGDTEVTTVDIPFQARQALLGMLKADIYAALRGVDVGRISGGQLTNTAIRALYSDIDLWADQAEWWVKDWVRAVMDTVADYRGIQLPPYNVTLTRRAIFDEVEQMDAIARQKGIVSDKTLFENHPLVKDAQGELERVEVEQVGAAYAGTEGVE